jgi:Zn-dependent M28 family amino/carboxypeptidase
MRISAIAGAIGTVGILTLSVVQTAYADNGTDTSALRDAVSADAIIDRLEALQAVADANGGNRAAGTPGYEASAQYVEEQLRAAGYDPIRQPFSYDQFVLSDTALEQVTPNPAVYVDQSDFSTMSYSGSGDVTAPVTAVDINLAGDRASTSGCEAADFASFTPGNIALIQRGTCAFRIKVDNAAAAGAAGVIVFNQGNVVPGDDRVGLVSGTLDAPLATIPAVGATFALGEELAGLSGLTMRLLVEAEVETIDSFNILADTGGREDRTVIVGAHLDSVGNGPGINDNGSGTAAILETAIQIAKSGDEPTNRVRFAFWGGEEDGLVGSDFYASQLTKRQIKDHAVNLNFDMVASPNFARFVYDGDGSAFGTTGPNGSAQIEKVFLDYFASQGLETAPTEFDGRSDYFGFINAGIPAGGLFTGAEGIKTAEEAEIYGGTAGEPYDACYHLACDTIDNVNALALEQMADAIAHSTLTFAETTSAVNGTAKGGGSGSTTPQYKGNKALA